MSTENYESEILSDNEEIAEDIQPFNPSDIVVYSRDWTIETIFAQIEQKNIDLNPKFQRRNAWTDDKRSKLIESVIMGYPVPEIVLAESPIKRRSFIVIDGKQRLLSIAGFMDHDSFQYWNTPKLKNLKIRSDLNGISYDELENNAQYSSELREFSNSSLRCTIITNFQENDVLYDIFYRLNSGSVPLSTQELRQVLNKGDFANYLIEVTNALEPIHQVLNLDGPDKRLRDIEIVLRLISFSLYASMYSGNLKKFLDDRMEEITKDWNNMRPIVENKYKKINECIVFLATVFGDIKKIGRKVTNGIFEKRFNRVLLEVQIFFFSKLNVDIIPPEGSAIFLTNFIDLCSNDPEFRSSIEATTKSLESYRIRYSKFEDLMNKSFGFNLSINPFKENDIEP